MLIQNMRFCFQIKHRISWSQVAAVAEGVVVVQYEPTLSFPKPQIYKYNASPCKQSHVGAPRVLGLSSKNLLKTEP